MLGNHLRHGVLPNGLGGIKIFKFNLAPEMVFVAIEDRLKVFSVIRVGGIDLQREVPAIAGRTADPGLDQRLLSLGLELLPLPSVVVKLDYVHSSTEADSHTSDVLRLGAGFVY